MLEIKQRQEEADLDRFHKACDIVMDTILGETESGYQITLGGAINQIFHHSEHSRDKGDGGVDRDKLKSLCDYADSKY
tara:strand:+ start:659 stop:892 length:234 start_codon:yes stop_codon:yes gene_type:complete